MMCEKCYSKTRVDATNEAVVMNIPTVSRWRVCLNESCQYRFRTVELPESAHKQSKPEEEGR